jgi:NTP pyrophosphatase (non-canonical NTP hydrolase)
MGGFFVLIGFCLGAYVAHLTLDIIEKRKLKKNNDREAIYYKNKTNLELWQDLTERIHKNAVEKGFWKEERHFGLLLMLVNTELCEALEAHRNRKPRAKLCDVFIEAPFNPTINYGDQDKKRFIELFEKDVRGTIDEEIADAVIRLIDICGYYHIDIGRIIELKMFYNKTREYMHGKKY